jgi:hypothetical protein
MVDADFSFISDSVIFLKSAYVNVYVLSCVSRNVSIKNAVVP